MHSGGGMGEMRVRDRLRLLSIRTDVRYLLVLRSFVGFSTMGSALRMHYRLTVLECLYMDDRLQARRDA